MAAMSFLDYVTLTLGWLINNGLWNVMASCGVIVLPFIFKFVGIMVKVREQSSFEGNHAPMIISRMEDYLYISMVVIFFTCYPSIPMETNVLHYQQGGFSSVVENGKLVPQQTSCSYAEVNPNSSSFKSVTVQLGGQSVYVPLWWYFVHSMSSGITQAAVTQLPCNTDLREVQSTISELAVDDPILMQEANAFYQYCFNPSFNKLNHQSKAIDESLIDDVTWPGSTYYLTTPGYYDTFRAQRPQKSWPYDATRDVGLTPGEFNTGYPSCKSWWSDSEVGLKAKLIANIETQIQRESNEKSKTGNLNPNINKFSFWQHLSTNKSERNEIVLRSVLTPKKFLSSANYMYVDYSGDTTSQKVGDAIASAGIIYKSLTNAIEVDALRQAAPAIQSVLLMSIIILLPIIITLGGFEPKVVITLTFVMFTVIFLTFVWELARFLDSRLIQIMYENNIVGFMNNKISTSNKSIIDLITSMVFIGFPLLLLAGMGWTGVKIGGQLGALVGDQSKTMQQAGSQGTDMTSKVGSSMVGKGTQIAKSKLKQKK